MYFRSYSVMLLGCLLLPAMLVLAVDPYHVWRDTRFNDNLYSTNQRYQNAGLIRQFLECVECQPAAVIIGTSVSENTTLEDLYETTGLNNAVRLIAHGSYPIEQYLTLKHALSSGKVALVFWEIYRNYASPDWDQFPGNNNFPVYLYNDSLFDDYQYLFNHSVVVSSIEMLAGTLDWSSDLSRLNSWQDEPLTAQRFVRFSAQEYLDLVGQQVAPRIEKWGATQPDWAQPVPVFERYILPLVEAYPEVRFVFFTPPVSHMRHGVDVGDSLSGQLVLRRELAELAQAKTNVSLYVFDDYRPLVTDLAFYKDDGHYTAAVNRWLLERMMADDPRFVMTPDQIYVHGEELWKQAVRYVPYSSCTNTPEKCGVLDAEKFNP